jgi:hypothetical protein
MNAPAKLGSGRFWQGKTMLRVPKPLEKSNFFHADGDPICITPHI